MRKFIQRVVEILDGAPQKSPTNQRGQSLVEMTLIMPVLLIMLLGVVEIGWYAQNILSLSEATRVGARRAPFLNGNYSPQSSDELGGAQSPRGVDRTILGYDADPRVALRGGYEPDGCGSILDRDVVFYNIIICATLDAMDPLVLDWDNGKDDIVVSAFSIQRIKIGADPVNDDIQPSTLGSATAYTAGTQVVVVGRYPALANECDLWNERDPFDWIENGGVDWAMEGTVRVPYEVASWDETLGDYVGFLDDVAADPEKQVGFSWTGNWQYIQADGTRTSCYGSQWKIEDVEDKANLSGFLTSEQDRQYLPNVGLVLVEVFWEHHLIFEDFPAMSAEWSPVYRIMGGSDPNTVADVIRAWALFPAPAVEPRLVFRPG